MELTALVARAENIALAAGERVFTAASRECPCCGWQGLQFRTLATPGYTRRGVLCPECGSFERHRALSFFYPRLFGTPNRRPHRLIHCAPEPCLKPVLVELCDRYETSHHGDPGASDHTLDLTRMALPDASCDAFVMNHVLDCLDGPVEQAAAELWRALGPGGIVAAAVTVEQGSTTRAVNFGNGMSRVFGTRDIAQVFAPFDVEIVDAAEAVRDRMRLGISVPVPVLVLRKLMPGEP